MRALVSIGLPAATAGLPRFDPPEIVEADLSALLREAELTASYRSADHLGFDELIDPRETRDQLLAALPRGLRARQAAAEPVQRTVILP